MRIDDKERFEAWLKEWSHQIGSHWSIYTFVKAAWKASLKFERTRVIKILDDIQCEEARDEIRKLYDPKEY
jgi:hypothetical protein